MTTQQKIEWLQQKVDAALEGLATDYPDGPSDTPAYEGRIQLLIDYATQLRDAHLEVPTE